MFAVVVTIQLEPGTSRDFLPIMRENAVSSLRDEIGCRQFDICVNPDIENTVLLYELYDSLDAFDAHLHSPHFLRCDAAMAPMIHEKTVATFTQVIQ
jgi:quinol monooxygenase YgiN